MDKTNEFNHEVAQKYEMKSHIEWVTGIEEGKIRYDSILEDIRNLRNRNLIAPVYLKDFFRNDPELWYNFVSHSMYKDCMEISGGICGALPFMSHWLQGRKISIDPLIVECHTYLNSFRESWFLDTDLISDKIENRKQEFINTIDGFILWRNGLDHLEDPFEALKVMSLYAREGCRLLLWTDIWHKDGKPDEGHRNICETQQEMVNIITNLGWYIQYTLDEVNPGTGKLEFGCFAIKK